MSIAFYLLTALLAATPILAITNDGVAQHAVTIIAAFMLAVAAMGPQAEITSAARLLKRLSLAILFPIVWMIIQIVPLAFASIVNPIWSTAAIALNDTSLPGHISIDPGTTFRSLISYLTTLSVMVATVIITRDRQRAQTILFVLSAVTTFMSVEVLLGQLDAFAGIVPGAGTVGAATFAAIAALAALTHGAIVLMAIERQLHRADPNLFSFPLLLNVSLGLCGIAFCLVAIGTLAPSSLFAAIGLGFAVIIFIAIARRLGLRPWPSAIGVLLLLAMVLAAAGLRFQIGSNGLLAFVASAAPDATALAQRALSDSSRVGSGAGTFELLSKVYQNFGAKAVLAPPSAAVAIAIEWGRPALLILLGCAVQVFLFTFRGALRRGRNSFFASLAAATVLIVLCEAFLDASLLSPTVQIIVAVIVGLGVAQSTGRTSGLEN